MTMLYVKMRKNLGPDKLIMVDGNMLSSRKRMDVCRLCDFSGIRPTDLPLCKPGLTLLKKHGLTPERLIVTENFESYWKNGGVTYTDEEGNKMPSLLGMAGWHPEEGRKGGCGHTIWNMNMHTIRNISSCDRPFK